MPPTLAPKSIFGLDILTYWLPKGTATSEYGLRILTYLVQPRRQWRLLGLWTCKPRKILFFRLSIRSVQTFVTVLSKSQRLWSYIGLQWCLCQCQIIHFKLKIRQNRLSAGLCRYHSDKPTQTGWGRERRGKVGRKGEEGKRAEGNEMAGNGRDNPVSINSSYGSDLVSPRK